MMRSVSIVMLSKARSLASIGKKFQRKDQKNL